MNLVEVNEIFVPMIGNVNERPSHKFMQIWQGNEFKRQRSTAGTYMTWEARWRRPS